MWSRPLTRKVMTDSSREKVATDSGTEEISYRDPSAGTVGEKTLETGSGSTTVRNSTPLLSSSASISTSGGNPVQGPGSSRRASTISSRSIEPVHQGPVEGGSTSGRKPVESTGTIADPASKSNENNVVASESSDVISSSDVRTTVSPTSCRTTPAITDPLRNPPPGSLPTDSTSTATQNTAITTSTSSEPAAPPTMSGNSDYHPTSRSSGSNANSNSSSSRRQRNGLFGINLDLNFDPSSWLVPSNVAGRSISSLSVLPDWVRHPVSIIPNRSSDNPASQSSSGLTEGRQQHHNHHGSSATGASSRLVTHSQGAGTGTAGSNWNSSSFQTSSSIPSNMHHHHHQHPHHGHGPIPLRTRHTVVSSMRSVDEDLDADYNPVSAIDIGAAGREHRGDAHSYVIDMDSPMGGWAEEDGAATSQGLRGASGGTAGSHTNNLSGATNAGSPAGDGNGSRRNISEAGVSPGGIPAGAPGSPGAGAVGADGNPPSMTDAATGANERTRAAEILRDAPETRAFINEISRYTTIRPFIVINFLKGVFDHGTSILAFLALVVTFSHANSMVKKEVSKQRKRNLLYLTMIVVNLMACVAFIYYIFNEMELYYALAFLPTRSDLSAFWSLMWAVGVTDYVAKFGTVFVKIVVVSLPGCLLPFQKRGKFYLFIEYSSQLYRSFLPVYPWLFYLVSAYEGTARMFGLLLAGIYVIFKITDSVKRFKDWLKALEKLLSNVHYGTNPTAKQLDGAGTICPICHDNFANPTRLQCTHIFCEECVATWFDRERTCPMCRAKVVDDPTYRDGSTSQYIQLF